MTGVPSMRTPAMRSVVMARTGSFGPVMMVMPLMGMGAIDYVR
jgi:hypothetical protein